MLDNENMARYVYLRSEGLTLPKEGFEKIATDPASFMGMLTKLEVLKTLGSAAGGVLGAGVNLGKTVADYALTKIPYTLGGAGAGAGALWWMLNRERRKQELKHLARTKKIQKEIDKMEQKLGHRFPGE